MNEQFFLSNLWRWKCGMPENEQAKPLSYDDLKQSEWSTEFEKLMRNRLVMGALRYGKLGIKDKPQYDRVGSIIKRMKNYAESGNKEILVDVANLCLCEFEECNHPNQHFHAMDDSEHTQMVK